MHWHLHTIGKPKLAYAREGMEEYLGRLRGFTRVEWQVHKASDQAGESTRLLDATVDRFRIVLDERGETLTSKKLAEKIVGWENSGRRRADLLIGGADGHTSAVRAEAGWCWSLGPLTLQHELATVVALEQIYRAYTINRGLPYHRA